MLQSLKETADDKQKKERKVITSGVSTVIFGELFLHPPSFTAASQEPWTRTGEKQEENKVTVLMMKEMRRAVARVSCGHTSAADAQCIAHAFDPRAAPPLK